MMSRILSGLTENRFGCGGLKLGGAENPNFDSSSSFVLTEAKGVSETSADDLIENLVVFGCLRIGIGRKIEGGARFRTPAIGGEREREREYRWLCVESEVNCVWVYRYIRGVENMTGNMVKTVMTDNIL